MACRGMGRVYHKGNRISHNIWGRKTNWSHLKKKYLVLRDKEVYSKDNSRLETFRWSLEFVGNKFLLNHKDLFRFFTNNMFVFSN